MTSFKTYESDRPVIFCHIPKCAGTSFIRLLKEWYSSRYHHPGQDETKDILLPRVEVKNKNGEWRKEVGVIHGHFDHGRGYGLPYHYPEVNQFFAFMRDPFELLVSMYFFAKGKSSRGEFLYRGKQVDIREIHPSVEAYLKVDQDWMCNHFPQDITLENLEEKMAQNCVYLGLFEDMQTSLDNLAFVLGKWRTELPLHNKSVYDEEVPEHLREFIYEKYPIAKKMHDYAKAHYRLVDFSLDKLAAPPSEKERIRRREAPMHKPKSPFAKLRSLLGLGS